MKENQTRKSKNKTFLERKTQTRKEAQRRDRYTPSSRLILA